MAFPLRAAALPESCVTLSVNTASSVKEGLTGGSIGAPVVLTEIV